MVAKAVVKILNDANIPQVRGVHAGSVPQNSGWPRLRVNTTMTPERCKQGIGLFSYFVQVDVFAHGYKAAAELAVAVRSALEGKSGIYSDVDVRDIRFDNETRSYDDTLDLENKVVEFIVNVNN